MGDGTLRSASVTDRDRLDRNVSEIKTEFKLGNQLPISDESYVYQQTGKNQLKKVCQNNEGRPL